MKIPNVVKRLAFDVLSLARIVSEDSQPNVMVEYLSSKSSKDS